jgi:hypothetical protein
MAPPHTMHGHWLLNTDAHRSLSMHCREKLDFLRIEGLGHASSGTSHSKASYRTSALVEDLCFLFSRRSYGEFAGVYDRAPAAIWANEYATIAG